MDEFCTMWVPNFGLIEKILFEALRGSENEPRKQPLEMRQAFVKPTKPFSFSVAEKKGYFLFTQHDVFKMML
ncbi:hypothetical protein AAY473_031622 [Plecturocebus cupreus]